MSNIINDLIMEQANECVEHEGVVTDTVMFRGMIEYLSNQSSDTISSKDIDEMAKGSVC